VQQSSVAVSEVVASVEVDGTAMQAKNISVNYSQSSYSGKGSIELVNLSDWEGVNFLDSIIITIDAQEYEMVVISKSKGETYDKQEYKLEVMSQAVLLDFPYAKEILVDYEIFGTESAIVNALGLLEGIPVVWDIPVDDHLTNDEVQPEGRSPLSVIREIVNDLGGIVQSYPDGSVHAVPRYEVNSDKYDVTTPATSYILGSDFISIDDSSDKRDGFNKYSVSNETFADGYTLESEQVTPSKFKIKAYKVPWNSTAVKLTTSELTNVLITASGITSEELTEEIEIVEGSGKVSKPCYSVVSYDYKTSTNLGAVTVDEDGTVSTATKENTLVTITYATKYWLWTATNIDEESVQFILEKL